MRIAVLIPYYGKFPKYFPLYLHSCSNNKEIDILIFTDIIYKEKYPDNVKFINISFLELQKIAEINLGFPIQLSSSYKLCDLKPAYSIVFKDYIINYDYWAYGDIDLIYGKLINTLLPIIKKDYEVISSRAEILSGSFSLFKNIPKINELYKEIPEYDKLLNQEKYQGVDETSHDHRTWMGESWEELPKNSFTYVVRNKQASGGILANFNTICTEYIEKNEFVVYENGCLFQNNIEILYFHYVLYKQKMFFSRKIKFPSRFYLNHYGYFNNIQWTYFRVFIVYCRIMKTFCKRVFTYLKKNQRFATNFS